MSLVEWLDGTPDSRWMDTRRRAAIAAKLKAEPGRWALVGSNHKNNRDAHALSGRGCEVTWVRTPTGGYDIYARHPLEGDA